MRSPWSCCLLAALVLSFLAARASGADELRVAVLEFQNSGPPGEFDALGKGLQSMVTTDLGQVPGLRLVERARLQELQAEIKLGGSGLVDARTAVRVGKLAGASHLLAGVFTVVGGKMRLESRLYSVERGDVLADEKIEGDKDAFFDLEKALVSKVIDRVGIKLQPKVRVAVTRVHTTDFEAFRKYSQGVQLFDEKKYDEALAALQEAKTRDEDFKLAQMTLDEYEQVIAKLRARANQIQAAEVQVAQLKQDQAVKAQLAVVQRLFAVAEKSSAGQDRLVALYALASLYSGHFSEQHEMLQRVQDEFAMQRTADALWKSYFAGATQVAPAMPLMGTSVRQPEAFSDPGRLDEDMKDLLDWLLEVNRGGFESNFTKIWAENLGPVSKLAKWLHLDMRGECRLRDTLLRLVEKLGPLPDESHRWQEDTALCLRKIGEYARSTARLSAIAARESSPRRIEDAASLIEANREMELLLAKARRRELLREFLTLSSLHDNWRLGGPAKDTAASLATGRPTTSDLRELNWYRLVSDDGYVLIGDAPLWMVRGGEYRAKLVVTGPRTDPRRAKELRYYRDQPEAGALGVVDGVPRRELEARLEIVYTPAEDYWPPDVWPDENMTSLAAVHMVTSRPEVGLVFGLRDVKAAGRPMRALEVAVGEDGVRLLEMTEADPEKPSTVKVLGEKRADLRSAKTLELSLRVAGGRAEVKVGGISASFPLPADHTGFYGVHVCGAGYAALRSISFSGKPRP